MLREMVCTHIAEDGGTPYYVGGCVRDELLGLTPKDFDIEVFDMGPARLKQILSNYGTICEVGMSFGVIKLRTPEGEIDFSTPRRENKQGKGHRGFVAEMDPSMSVAEAASRRDFTINAIYKDAVTGEIHDYFDGQAHLKRGWLIAVSTHFEEDPLRVLRGMQFASRFGFRIPQTGPTADMCGRLMKEYELLPVERVGEEWRKWAKGDYPSQGLLLLRTTGWELLYPEIIAMKGVPQDPQWHPEGDVYFHTCYVCNAMSSICDRENITGEDREVFMFAALTHDMGKPYTTIFEKERWRSPGHAEAGVPLARTFLKSIGIFEKIIERVSPLVAQHMFPTWEPQSRRTIRRLKVRLEPCSLDELLLLMEADASGRPPYPASKPQGYDEIVSLAADLPPKIEPIVGGIAIMNAYRMLTGEVMPGPKIGPVKKAAFEAQLNEEFVTHDEGVAWVYNYMVQNK